MTSAQAKKLEKRYTVDYQFKNMWMVGRHTDNGWARLFLREATDDNKVYIFGHVFKIVYWERAHGWYIQKGYRLEYGKEESLRV